MYCLTGTFYPTTEELETAVYNINMDLEEVSGDNELVSDCFVGLTIYLNGHQSVVEFLGQDIYNSEENDDYVEELDVSVDIETHLRYKLNRFIHLISQLKIK